MKLNHIMNRVILVSFALFCINAYAQERLDSIIFNGWKITYDISRFLQSKTVIDSIPGCPGIMKQYYCNPSLLHKAEYAEVFFCYVGYPMGWSWDSQDDVTQYVSISHSQERISYRIIRDARCSRYDFLNEGHIFLGYDYVQPEDCEDFDILVDSVRIQFIESKNKNHSLSKFIRKLLGY